MFHWSSDALPLPAAPMAIMGQVVKKADMVIRMHVGEQNTARVSCPLRTYIRPTLAIHT